jgi:hypothetical protein
MELLLDEASTFLDDPARHEQAKTVIRKLSHKYGQTPWAYLKGMETIGEAIDTQHLHQILEDCEDLEELLKVQHAFPHDANIKAVVQRKQDLLDMAYRGGRLAMLSHQNARAVQQFQKILLYDAGSDREQEARDAIYRLNTLKSNPF